MRGLLRRLGARTGISLGLIVVVVGGPRHRSLGGGGRTHLRTAVPNRAVPTVDPTAGDDGPVAPTPSAFADNDAVRSAATTFIDGMAAA